MKNKVKTAGKLLVVSAVSLAWLAWLKKHVKVIILDEEDGHKAFDYLKDLNRQ